MPQITRDIYFKTRNFLLMTILWGSICTTLPSFRLMDVHLHKHVGIILIYPSNAVSDYFCVPKTLVRKVCVFPRYNFPRIRREYNKLGLMP